MVDWTTEITFDCSLSPRPGLVVTCLPYIAIHVDEGGNKIGRAGLMDRWTQEGDVPTSHKKHWKLKHKLMTMFPKSYLSHSLGDPYIMTA